ncbi:MAG: hypothetical protein J6C78_02845 [Muribaculaceae bacterium]|nr:hypothetical protein [Muribaculaceae bacterium]
MKKFVLILMLAIGASLGVNAQTKNISVSYGGYTQMDACDMHDGWHGVDNAWGALTFAANFKVARDLWLGPSYTFSSTSVKGHKSAKIYYHVIMMNLRYDYYKNSICTVYAHGGIGADISHLTYPDDAYNKGYFAFQASPLCAEVQLSRSFTMFGEAGFGAQGLLQAGFRINL